MTAIFTNKFRHLAANLFYDQLKGMNVVSGTIKNMYLYIGRSKPWDAPYSDDYPPLPSPTISAEYDAHTDLLAMKKVDSNANVSLVVPRYDWVSGVVYSKYDDLDIELYNHPSEEDLSYVSTLPPSQQYIPGSFYVLTSNWEVYVCIATGRGIFGRDGKSNASTVMPTGGPTAASTNYVVTMSDGYTWKYLYTISQTEISRYVTDSWIPVKFLTAPDSSDQWAIQNAATDGVSSAVLEDPTIYPVVWYGDPTQLGEPSNDGVSNLQISSIDIDIANLVGPAAATDPDIFKYSALVAVTGAVVSIHDIAGSAYSAPNHTITIANTFDLGTVGLPATKFYIAPKVVVSGIYASSPSVRALVNPSTSIIDSVVVAEEGSGVKQAALTFYGRSSTDYGLLEGPQARLVIPPAGGHGANPVTELGGWFVEVGVKLNNAEGIDNDGNHDFPLINDYRRVGLISDVRKYDDSGYTEDVTLRGCWVLEVDNVILTSAPSFEPDELIEVSGSSPLKSGYVIESKTLGAGTVPGSSKLRVKYFQNAETGVTSFEVGDLVTGQSSSLVGDITAVVTPEQKPYSGNMLFIDQTKAIIRREEQQEEIRITIEF